jgi:hypothetical protein
MPDRRALERPEFLVALKRRALKLLEAYMNLKAANTDIQCFRVIATVRWPPAKRDGQPKPTSARVLQRASLRPLLAFSNRPIWQPGTARACVVFDPWSGSSHSDGERSLPRTRLAKQELALEHAPEYLGSRLT